jgi:hypothetical protein
VITVPSADFASLQQFTTYDEEAVVKLNVKLDGDVAISMFHARQTFGGLFSKMDGVVMCKVYFHTGFLAPNSSCIKFKLRDLDGVAAPEKYGPEFKAVINYRIEKDAAKIQSIRADWDLGLIFNSKADYELNRAMLFGDQPPSKTPSPPPQAPPRAHRPPPVPPKPEKSRTPSPVLPKVDELLIDSHSRAPPLPPKLLAESISLARPASDTLLLDLGFNGSGGPTPNPSVACTNPSVEILLNLSGSNSTPLPHPEDPFFKPAGQVKTVSSSADIFGSAAAQQNQDLLGSGSNRGVMPDLFIGAAARSKPAMPDLFGSTMSAPIPDLFGTTARPHQASPIPDLFGSAVAPSMSTSKPPDLFGDNLLGSSVAGPPKPVLSPTSAFQPKPAMSVGEELLSNLLGDLDMKSSASKSGTAKPGATPQAQAARKPNYNSAFFQSSSQPQKQKAKLTEDTFNDLLGGFSTNNGNSSAGKGSFTRKSYFALSLQVY